MTQIVMHATSVAFEGKGLLIRGASGAGKSGLALELMARGAHLIADDRTIVTNTDQGLWLTCPAAIRGMIEARHLGILHADASAGALCVAILDMDVTETQRLPPIRTRMLMGRAVTLLHNSASPYFPAGVIHYLRSGRRE